MSMARQHKVSAPPAEPPRAGPFPGRIDLAAIAGLVVLCTLAWCSANGVWSLADLREPTAYLDPEKCDVIHALAMMKAGTKGEFLPLAWKQVPDLGAPYGANWNDWPFVEELLVNAFALLAATCGLFPGLNLAAMLGNSLAAVVFYLVARASACTPRWAFVGGLAFGLAPFIFAQQPFHITCEWVWQIPLFLPVWRCVATPPGLAFGSTSLRRAVAVGLVAGLMNPYYTNILCQLTLLGAAAEFYRTRSRPALLAALCVIAAAACTFALMNLDTWTYRFAHGPNAGAVVREYKWLEIYGLKIKDLLIPPLTHRSDAFAAFSAAHRQAAPLLDEAASYQGLVGLACLAWLVGTAVKALLDRRLADVPLEVWQLLWILLMFTTGGLNAIIGAFGFTLFRGGSRYAIVILAITLMYAARRLSRMESAAEAAAPARGGLAWTMAAVIACLVILWDQVPRPPTAEAKATIASQVAADREFTGRMEAALPAGAMVFQLPVMEFPEVPAPGVPPYDHFRPYLYSRNLRYSFGSMKGRERDRWQQAVQAKLFEGAALDQQAQRIKVNPANARAAIDELRRLGFAALYVNRNGFPDRAKGLEEALLEMGYADPPIRNATGDLACFPLGKAEAGGAASPQD
jgi:phosphoglycerol transferase